MLGFTLEQVKEGLRQCLIEKNCKKCPFFTLYYNEPRNNSCTDFLYKNIKEILLRFEILNDNE